MRTKIKKLVRKARIKLAMALLPADTRENVRNSAEAWWSLRENPHEFRDRLSHIREIEFRK